MIYEKKKYGDKNIIPAGLLYYNIQDPIVEAKKDDDEVEALIRKELRMKGVVNSNKNIISMMDSTEGSSVNIPVSYNKSGELDMRYSRVMTTDESISLVNMLIKKMSITQERYLMEALISIRILRVMRTVVLIVSITVCVDLAQICRVQVIEDFPI